MASGNTDSSAWLDEPQHIGETRGLVPGLGSLEGAHRKPQAPKPWDRHQ